MGQRRVARPAARSPMGLRVLGQVLTGVSVDRRILGRGAVKRNRIPARAAGDRGSRSQHARPVVGPQLDPGLLDLASWALRLASGLLGDRAVEIGRAHVWTRVTGTSGMR